MELIHNRDSKIIFTNGTETFEFFNLADYSYDVGETKNFWMLSGYERKIFKYKGDPGNIKLKVTVAFNPNGTYAWIDSGYFLNDIIRRELHLDSEGIIEKDDILVFDPQCPNNLMIYSANEAMKARNQVPPKVYYKMKETSEED